VTDGVIIVGAGPVGLCCALFLSRNGIPVTVLEAEAELGEDLRASTFHPPTLDMLDEYDVAAALLPQGHQVPQWQYRIHDSGERAVFDLGVIADVTRHPYRFQCEQFRLTRILVEQFAADDRVDVQFGTALVDVTQHDAGVTARVVKQGETVELTARYLIGCDGARSSVRACLGETLRGKTYPRTSITTIVDFPFEDHLDDILFVNYCWTPTDHFSLMRVRDTWRTGHSPRPGQSVEAALSEEAIEEHLQEVFPRTGRYAVLRKAAYTVHRRIVDSFRHGRVLLAGDAAHLNSPSGGMGMNSGIHDAYALATALVGVYRGESEALLERYARQRRQVAIDDVQTRSDLNYHRHRERDPEKRRTIWAEFKRTAQDRDLMRAFLLESSMIASLQRAAAIA
jgi:3-(3-hydroxy-phenyl)propionate hydroxylase